MDEVREALTVVAWCRCRPLYGLRLKRNPSPETYSISSLIPRLPDFYAAECTFIAFKFGSYKILTYSIKFAKY